MKNTEIELSFGEKSLAVTLNGAGTSIECTRRKSPITLSYIHKLDADQLKRAIDRLIKAPTEVSKPKTSHSSDHMFGQFKVAPAWSKEMKAKYVPADGDYFIVTNSIKADSEYIGMVFSCQKRADTLLVAKSGGRDIWLSIGANTFTQISERDYFALVEVADR